MDETKKIEELIVEALSKTAELINQGSCSGSKIITPHYREKEDREKTIRCSEQELKQIFLNLIENDKTFYYSVETPSKHLYRFKDKAHPTVLFDEQEETEKHQSAMIDVSLYNSSNVEEDLLSHIEFKYGQCKIFPIQKDFLKLICESNSKKRNYFVHYLNPSDSGSKEAIFKKYEQAVEGIKKTNKNIQDIDKKLENVIVFIMFIDLNEAFKFSLRNQKDKVTINI